MESKRKTNQDFMEVRKIYSKSTKHKIEIPKIKYWKCWILAVEQQTMMI